VKVVFNFFEKNELIAVLWVALIGFHDVFNRKIAAKSLAVSSQICNFVP
jgi:hypothetical protein